MVNFRMFYGHARRKRKDAIKRPAVLVHPLSVEAMSVYRDVAECYLDVTGYEELCEHVSSLEGDTEHVTTSGRCHGGQTSHVPPAIADTHLRCCRHWTPARVASKPFATPRISERQSQSGGASIVLNWFRGGHLTWK
jgi:hypothetical protein